MLGDRAFDARAEKGQDLGHAIHGKKSDAEDPFADDIMHETMLGDRTLVPRAKQGHKK